MARYVTDDFNRADNASLGTNWTTRQGGTDGFKIATNTATPTSYSASDITEFWSGTTWPKDQYSQATVTGLSGTGDQLGLGVGVRIRTDNIGGGTSFLSFYVAVVNTAASNQVAVSKEVAGVYTLIGQRTQAFSDGDTLRLEVQGTILRVYRNGVQLGADFTDSSVAWGSPGLAMYAPMTAGTLDNWEGGDMGQDVPPADPNLVYLRKNV